MNLLLHPLVEEEARLRSTRQLAGKLQAAGVPVTLKLHPHASHTTLIGAFAWLLRWLAPVLDNVQAFIAASATPAEYKAMWRNDHADADGRFVSYRSAKPENRSRLPEGTTRSCRCAAPSR